MEEKDLIQRFHGTFELMMPILRDAYKGFLSDNPTLLKECIARFKKMHNAVTPFLEKIIAEKEKDQMEKKYVNLVFAFQPIALAIENLIARMLVKVETNIPFSEISINEIKSLLEIAYVQFRNVNDYMLTKNPTLKNSVITSKEKVFQLAIDYKFVHQNRLISGTCMPMASYLYIDFVHALKRISNGLAEFVEMV